MQGSSGLIVAFVVALWAAYFVPLILRRYDETGKNAVLDHESTDRRVVAPKRTVSAAEPVQATAAVPVDRTSPAVEVQRKPITRAAARAAARRRRNVLLFLLTVTAVLGGLAVGAVLPVWSPAVGVGLIVGWLVLCRVMVRAERGIESSGRLRGVLGAAGRALMVVPKSLAKFIGWTAGRVRPLAAHRTGSAADEELTVVVSDQVEDFDPNRRNQMELDAPLAEDALEEQLQIAVPSVSASTGEPMWDPLPITVPTYVSKPRAGRTVRTIEFGEPGSWTSGHVEGEQTELPIGEADTDHGEERRAVGH